MTFGSSARCLVPLLRLQARALLHGLGLRAGSGRARAVGAAALAVLLAVLVAAYLWLLGQGMVAAGAAGALPALAALLGSLASVALVFAKAPGTLFGCRDYDLVAALPVPTPVVVLARTAPLYGFGAAVSALMSAPLYAAYFSAVPPAPASVAAAALCAVLAPLAPAAVATLVSLALTALAVRARHAGAVQLALSAALVVLVVAGSLAFGGVFAGTDDAAALTAVGDATGAVVAAVSSAYPPAAWAAAAVTEGSVAGLVAFAALSLACPALVTAGLAARYPVANALVAASPRERGGVVASGSAASPLRALVAKELHTVAAMPAYALNDCAGLLLMVLAAAGVAFAGVDAILTSGAIDGVRLDVGTAVALRGQVEAALPWAFGFCGAISLTAGPSVSLEGGSVWLMLTAPVPARTVLTSKLLANLVLGGAAAAISAAVLLAGGVAPLLVLQCVVCALGMLTGFAALALAIDASRPNLAWVSPIEVVKRGLPVMVGSLGGVAASLGLGVLSVMACGTLGPAASLALNLVAPLVAAGAGVAAFRIVAARGLPGPRWDA